MIIERTLPLAIVLSLSALLTACSALSEDGATEVAPAAAAGSSPIGGSSP